MSASGRGDAEHEPARAAGEPTRLHFRRIQRLSGLGVFKSVLDARARCDAGPISFHARPSEATCTRLGISIGRRAGSAARRNRIKRLLREAFRLTQPAHPREAPAPYDLVIVVRAHEPLSLAEYQSRLLEAFRHLHATWVKRTNRPRGMQDAPNAPRTREAAGDGRSPRDGAPGS